MDSTRRKPQQMYQGYKTSNPQLMCVDNNNYSTTSGHGFMRTPRIQRHSLKWRNDHYYTNGYRPRHPYKRSETLAKKFNKSAEDAEEEERKKKLNDTAKKLLSKIKTWNAEKNVSSEEDSQQTSNQVTNECSSEKFSADDKPRRIAHAKKARLVKNRTRKSFNQPSKTITRYDVNKETVKDFQNRIQHKLIEEIMQMPKENLQNVLNDPKINPIMELKMSRLVRENKPLIAQKLRALAESKMKMLGSSNSQLLVDIDKLIDPVIETDLSLLPYELIKQMENVFQVQFDYSPNSIKDSQVDGDNMEGQKCGTEMNNPETNIKLENNFFSEDLSLYECSTDEDEEVMANRCSVLDQEHNINLAGGSSTLNTNEESTRSVENVQSNLDAKHSNIENSATVQTTEINKLEKENLASNKLKEQTKSQSSSKNRASSYSSPLTSESCQTDSNFQHVSTQTEEEKTLYGVPLPKESTDDNIPSLMEEINLIQNLTNKLNERRLMIFLQLAKKNVLGNLVCDDVMKRNFLETLSNGSLYLVESLQEFFKVCSKDFKNTKFRTSEKRCKTPNRRVNKGRPKSKEDR